MIEQSIYFALGCIITALLALGFAPIFWHRALRLTRQRLRLQVPLSMQEIVAERDQLRAEFAVERVRLEQTVDRIQATKAADMAEIGRRTVEASRLADAVAALQNVERAQEREIDLLLREIAEAGAENSALKTGLHAAYGLVDGLRREAEADRQRLQELAEDRRTTVASLDTRAMGLEMRLTDAQRAVSAKEKAEEGLRGKLEAAVAQAARHEVAGLSLRRELDETKAHIRSLEQDLDASRGMIEDLREREKGLHLQRSLQSERARGTDRAMGEKLDLLRAENAALEDALAAARSLGDADDAGLRSSIHALGLAVARMARGSLPVEKAAPAGAPERRRDEAPVSLDAH